MLVIGNTEYGRTRHLIVRRSSDGAKSLLPEWMTTPEASTIRIVSCPRISVSRLAELRALIDELMASSPGKRVDGGQSNETLDSTTTSNGSVQDKAAARAKAASTSEGAGAAKSASQRGDVRRRRRSQKRRGAGGGR